MASEYEQLRLRNLQDNKRILAELGLLNNPFKPMRPIKKAPKRKGGDHTWKPSKKKFIVTTDEDAEEAVASDQDLGSVHGERRRSSRIKGIPAKEVTEEMKRAMAEADDEEQKELKAKRAAMRDRPMVYGPIAGVEMGTVWETRMQCNAAGIHRPPVSGIHAGPEGAYSIALSGGYEDDIDLGECFTYTGEGGRDLTGTSAKPKNLRTAAQSKDQCLSRGNAALVQSVEVGHPVRVIRGYKSKSQYAPEEGYRYDGLYVVDKHWYTVGMAGFKVYKFALRRLTNQAPPPWTYADEDTKENEANASKSDADKEEEEEIEKPTLKPCKEIELESDADKEEEIEKPTHKPCKENESESDADKEETEKPTHKPCKENESESDADKEETEKPTHKPCKENDSERGADKEEEEETEKSTHKPCKENDSERGADKEKEEETEKSTHKPCKENESESDADKKEVETKKVTCGRVGGIMKIDRKIDWARRKELRFMRNVLNDA